MKKLKKLAALLVAGSCLVTGLTGCSKVADEIVTSIVQWNLDSIYLNQHNETFLGLVGSTKEQAEQDYLTGIEYEADFFAYYWGITDDMTITYADLDEDLQNKIVELYQNISSKAKYEVQSAVAQDDSSYAVKVVIEPIDIMEQANEIYMNGTYEPLNAYMEKYADADFENMSDEEYLAINNEYGYLIVDMVEELLPNLGYMEAKSQSIQMESIDDVWSINEDDLATFNEYVVYYP